MEAIYGVGFLVTAIFCLKSWLDKRDAQIRLDHIDKNEIEPLLKRINYLEGENMMLITSHIDNKVQ